MTVFVDDMKASFQPAHAPGRRYVMCHMIADQEEELHAMADKIGVARKWYQGDHYDITQSKRALAVKAGAIEISLRELSKMAMARRRGFEGMAVMEALREIAHRDYGAGAKRLKNISTRIEEDLYARVAAAARADGRTMASWIRRVMLERIEANEFVRECTKAVTGTVAKELDFSECRKFTHDPGDGQ